MPSRDEIEAAAEAGYENGRSKWHYPKYQITYTDGSPWDDLTKDAKDWYMDNAKAALIAAEAVRNRDTDRDNTGPTIEDGWTQETAPKLAPEESDASGVARSLVIALQAALPHLEAAGDARIEQLEDALDQQRQAWDEAMAEAEDEGRQAGQSRYTALVEKIEGEIERLERVRTGPDVGRFGVYRIGGAIEALESLLPKDREPFGNSDQLESPLPEDREAPTNPGAVSAAKSEQCRLHHYRAAVEADD